MLPLLLVAFGFAIFTLFRDSNRQKWMIGIAIAGAIAVLLGKFVFDSVSLTLSASTLFITPFVASTWLSWKHGCSKCDISSIQTSISNTLPTADGPIACTLNRTQFERRKELVEQVAQESIERKRLSNGVALRFRPDEGRITQLAKLVALEQSCCPFLNFKIEARAGDSVWLEMTGPAEAQSIIFELIPNRLTSPLSETGH